MKITERQLKQIIREELGSLLEATTPGPNFRSEIGNPVTDAERAAKLRGDSGDPARGVPDRESRPAGKDLSRKVTGTYVQGPAEILSDRNGKQKHLVTVGEGEGVMIRFEDK